MPPNSDGHGLTIYITAERLITVISLTGEFEQESTERVGAALADVLLSRPSFVVVDLGGLSTLDPGALHVLESARQVLRSGGCDLLVRGPSASVKVAPELAGLDPFLEGPSAHFAEEPLRTSAGFDPRAALI